MRKNNNTNKKGPPSLSDWIWNLFRKRYPKLTLTLFVVCGGFITINSFLLTFTNSPFSSWLISSVGLEKPKIFIVKIAVREDLYNPRIDVIIRNDDNRVAIVTGYKLIIISTNPSSSTVIGNAGLPVSGKYDIKINPKSQFIINDQIEPLQIPAKEADRFIITLAQTTKDTSLLWVDYKIAIEVIYDQGKVLRSQPFEVRLFTQLDTYE